MVRTDMSPVASGLAGFYDKHSTGKVHCVDCDCYPPGWLSIHSDDPELGDYQCDLCGVMLDQVDPVSTTQWTPEMGSHRP